MSGPAEFDLDEVKKLDDDRALYGDITVEQEQLTKLSAGWSLTTWVAAAVLLLLFALISAQTLLTFLSLWATNPFIAAVLGGIGLLAFCVLSLWTLRELRAIFRLRAAGAVQADAQTATWNQDEALAAKVLPRLERLHKRSPALAQFRETAPSSPTALEKLDRFELTVLRDADEQAQQRIVAASRDSAIFTALSPFASLDVVISLWRNVRMIREIAQVYGLAPNWHQSARLLRKALFQGVVAGGMEAGDGLINNLLGHGIAGQLSAKLGEGMVNGLMTSRIGLAAMEDCRALPFKALERPKLTALAADVAKQVTGQISSSVSSAVAGGNAKAGANADTRTKSSAGGSSKARAPERRAPAKQKPTRKAASETTNGPVTLDASQVRSIDQLD